MSEREQPEEKNQPKEPETPKEEPPRVLKTNVDSTLLGKGVIEKQGDKITFTPYGPGLAAPVPSHRIDEKGNVLGEITGRPLAPLVNPEDIPSSEGQPSHSQESQQPRRGNTYGIPSRGTGKWPKIPRNPDGSPRANPSLPHEERPQTPPTPENGGPKGGK